ncbi:MAG: hypothetical protein V4451_05785 [Pseudomonadota bacterium]
MGHLDAALTPGALWLLGIVGWLVTVVVSYRAGLNQAKAARRAAAAAEYRSALNKAVTGLPRTRKDWQPGEALTDWKKPVYDALSGISHAAMNYRAFLPKDKQKAVDAAWARFSTHAEHGVPNVQATGVIHYGDPFGEIKARKELISLIGAMALLAEET